MDWYRQHFISIPFSGTSGFSDQHSAVRALIAVPGLSRGAAPSSPGSTAHRSSRSSAPSQRCAPGLCWWQWAPQTGFQDLQRRPEIKKQRVGYVFGAKDLCCTESYGTAATEAGQDEFCTISHTYLDRTHGLLPFSSPPWSWQAWIT